MNVINGIVRVAKNVGRALKSAAPEIAIVTGTVGLVTAGVIACKQTPKAMAVAKEHNEKVDICDKCLEDGVTSTGDEYTADDHKKDRAMIFTQDALAMAKVYAIPLIIAALSVTSIFAGGRIFRKRLTALGGAYALLESTFAKYRKGVIDKFGEDVDKELKYGFKKELVEEKSVDENGKENSEIKEETVTDYDGYSQYARFFDETCPDWEKDGGKNLSFLINQQKWANDRLFREHVLFLNDVYTSLGIPRTAQGQYAGWIYDPSNPNIDSYVDFGIQDVIRDKAKFKDFMKDRERSILLDFNCDGNILHKFEKFDKA